MAINRSPSDRDLETQSDALRSALEEQRRVGLAHVAELNQVRLRAAVREHDLAEAEARKARPLAVSSRARFAAALARGSERSRIPVVSAEPQQAVLHGRVLGADGTGLEGLGVVVADARGREAARTLTAEIGYFKFVFPPVPPAKPQGDQGSPKEVQVRLQVLQADGKAMGRATDLITLGVGKVIYRELPAT